MFKTYMANQQFNFQINRYLEDYVNDSEVQDTIHNAVEHLTDMASWNKTWTHIAQQSEANKQYRLATNYYLLAHFYLNNDDETETESYASIKRNFNKSTADNPLTVTDIPFQGKTFPAVQLTNVHATKTLLFHGGFDSTLEELLLMGLKLQKVLPDYNFVIFEGPGQGRAAKNGLYLTIEWEKPVSAVLDFYHLTQVDLLGMSLGGLLALRAAAHEPRINKVIAYDIMYSMMDAMTMNAKRIQKFALTHLQSGVVGKLINAVMPTMVNKNVDLAFKFHQAVDLTGLRKPIEVLREVAKYNLKDTLQHVNQDVLLLAGTDDQYVPYERLQQIEKELSSVKSMKSVTFNKSTGGNQHCQIGNRSLAIDEFVKFLED